MPKVKRMMSGCATPTQQLLRAIKDNDVEALQRLLAEDKVKCDKNLEAPHLISPLQLASKLHPDVADDEESCLKLLLAVSDDPNHANESRDGKRALHFAGEASNFRALQVLLEDARVDINALTTMGWTVLHVLVNRPTPETSNSAHRLKKCLDLLLGVPGLDVNKQDCHRRTAIYCAASKGNKLAVEALLDSGRIDVDIAAVQNNSTARKLITQKFPDLEGKLPKEGSVRAAADPVTTLFHLLYNRKCANFIVKLGETLHVAAGKEERRNIVDGDNGYWTLLQYACNFGMTDVARALLENGADPNATSQCRRHLLPSVLAAAGGFDAILELLLGDRRTRLCPAAAGEQTALHAVLKTARWEARDANRRRCFDLLMDAAGADELRVNAGDILGDTALHLAAVSGDQHYVLALLRKGAYVGQKNRFGELPLASIPANTLKRFLDECVDCNDEIARDDKFEISFDYSFLAPPSQQQQDGEEDEEAMGDRRKHVFPVPESNPLVYISKSADLRPLLKHPVITSFLCLKWFSMRPIFFVNVSFYAFFVLLLTGYILFVYEYPVVDAAAGDGNSTTVLLQTSASPATWGVLAVLLVVLFVRELFQFLVWPKHYLLDLENYLEVVLIAVCATVLFGSFENANVRTHLSALAILFSWAELVLLIGKHPSLSTNIEMLKTVSKNFLQFLAWYSLLILAFALSFYTLFRSSHEDNNFFLNPGSSFFKTVVMVTGEFDASDIPFVMFPVTSHLVFVLFVFLVAIVLFNLLNGLAVSDTQSIKDDAELVGYVSRVKLVSYTESMLLGHPLWCQTPANCCCCCACCCRLPFHFYQVPALLRRVNLFSSVVPDKRIRVLPNQECRIVTKSDDAKSSSAYGDHDDAAATCSPCVDLKLEKKVVDEAKNVLEEKSQVSDVDRIVEILARLQEEVSACHEQLKELRSVAA